jgi:hypothetical protein
MNVTSPFAIGAWSLVSTAAIRQWMGTLDYQVEFGDPEVDPVHPRYRGAKIYVFWHENILMPLYLRGHSNIAMLLSRHTDANILDRVARMMGFGVVRGSTFRGGSAALRELAERAAVGNLTITPDGPRGPRRRLAPGCVFLASTLGIPIVAMGMGYDLDRDGIERHRAGIESLLTHLSNEAEAWATARHRRPGQRAVRKEASRVALQRACEPGAPGVLLDEELALHGLPAGDVRAAAA